MIARRDDAGSDASASGFAAQSWSAGLRGCHRRGGELADDLGQKPSS